MRFDCADVTSTQAYFLVGKKHVGRGRHDWFSLHINFTLIQGKKFKFLFSCLYVPVFAGISESQFVFPSQIKF